MSTKNNNQSYRSEMLNLATPSEIRLIFPSSAQDANTGRWITKSGKMISVFMQQVLIYLCRGNEYTYFNNVPMFKLLRERLAAVLNSTGQISHADGLFTITDLVFGIQENDNKERSIIFNFCDIIRSKTDRTIEKIRVLHRVIFTPAMVEVAESVDVLLDYYKKIIENSSNDSKKLDMVTKMSVSDFAGLCELISYLFILSKNPIPYTVAAALEGQSPRSLRNMMFSNVDDTLLDLFSNSSDYHSTSTKGIFVQARTPAVAERSVFNEFASKVRVYAYDGLFVQVTGMKICSLPNVIDILPSFVLRPTVVPEPKTENA